VAKQSLGSPSAPPHLPTTQRGIASIKGKERAPPPTGSVLTYETTDDEEEVQEDEFESADSILARQLAIADARTRAKPIGQKVTIQLPTKKVVTGINVPKGRGIQIQNRPQTNPSTKSPQTGIMPQNCGQNP
jgi:hypothetical protein